MTRIEQIRQPENGRSGLDSNAGKLAVASADLSRRAPAPASDASSSGSAAISLANSDRLSDSDLFILFQGLLGTQNEQ